MAAPYVGFASVALYHAAEAPKGGQCITRQSTPTPKGVRSVAALPAHLFLVAGYFYVMPHVSRVAAVSEAASNAASF